MMEVQLKEDLRLRKDTEELTQEISDLCNEGLGDLFKEKVINIFDVGEADDTTTKVGKYFVKGLKIARKGGTILKKTSKKLDKMEEDLKFLQDKNEILSNDLCEINNRLNDMTKQLAKMTSILEALKSKKNDKIDFKLKAD